MRSRARNLEEGNAICVHTDVSSYNSAQFKTALVFNVHDVWQCAGLTGV
jgi:hypothetical protein